jgi:crotonobetainyl-CoA:carnitine CoA-transferase CaiB-like acyl-CoA transferase
MLGFPVFMSDTPAVLAHTAPRLGQHSFEVMSDILGYSPEDIVRLTQQKVVR